MKLNEIELNEDMSYGQAVSQNTGRGALRQLGGAIKSAFSPSSLAKGFKLGQSSMDDTNVNTMATSNFINKTANQIASDLESGIKSGLVNPDLKAGLTSPSQEVQPQPTTQPTTQQTQQPAAKTPEQIRIEKQKAAATAAQQQMNPAAPANTAQPTQAAKMTPQQAAALKGRLRGKAGATSATSGFKNYVGGSGERMTGVDPSGAPIFKKIQRESTGEGQYTISDRVQHFMNRFLGNAAKVPQTQAQIKRLADRVQDTYMSDRGRSAIYQLANLAYASMNDKGPEAAPVARPSTPPPPPPYRPSPVAESKSYKVWGEK